MNPKVYPMKHKQRGLILIINNAKFVKTDNVELKYRGGSVIDVMALEEVFSQLNFDVHKAQNKTKEVRR